MSTVRIGRPLIDVSAPSRSVTQMAASRMLRAEISVV
jgi:hypothetical protein